MSGVLGHIRVLDFGRFIAGPYCGAILADFGADVIRVEKIGGNEDRFLGAHLAETGEGPVFMQHNRNKRSLAVDPQSPDGKEIIRRLVRTADVVIANMPWNALPKMGLDYESLREIRSDIILATTSSFGRTGPYRSRLGFDGVAQAMSGGTWLTGTGDGTPVKAAVQYADYGTALLSAIGVLMALQHRDRTGEGQVVESNLLLTSMTFASTYLIDQAVLGKNRPQNSNRSQTSAPSGVFRASDGWLVVQTATNPLFRRWARLMGEEDRWLRDARFKDDINRGDHGEIICARMQEWCSERTLEECIATLEKAGIPAGPVLSTQKVLDNAHVTEAEMLHQVDFPGMRKPAPITVTQAILSKTPGTIRKRPPLAGEHNTEILDSLGYDEAGIRRLEDSGVIRSGSAQSPL